MVSNANRRPRFHRRDAGLAPPTGKGAPTALRSLFAKVGVTSRRELAARLLVDHHLPLMFSGTDIGADGWFLGFDGQMTPLAAFSGSKSPVGRKASLRPAALRATSPARRNTRVYFRNRPLSGRFRKSTGVSTAR